MNITDRIILVQEDLTQMDVAAIVNAANRSLLGGGGVDGAIHRAAGSGLLEECRALNGCATGSAKITGGHKLKAKHVIHAVGPIWHGGDSGEDNLLQSAYKTCLELAGQYKCKSLAFPNISTGVYGFPKRKAAPIAIKAVKEFLEKNELPEKVYFVCFDSENYALYDDFLSQDLKF
ncbi:MAG: O-acetyl-ADP-ribose deacetylase [Bacteroidales bacterium]|nr:O-acetyl-ADP-ribose deacetylase [Bacteroidales bacterium]